MNAPAAPPGVDLTALRDHLDRHVPELLTGPISAELIAGGRSNLTYRLTDGTTTWVLRRPPLGHVLPTAHNMAREHRVITALHDTAVPVPATVALCEDSDVLGAPFYLMQHVAGRVYRTGADLAELTAGQGRALSRRFVDILADLHRLDPASIGLGDFGRPDGYLRRQVDRWTRQLAASRSRDLPGIERLGERLAATLPTTRRTALLHGDYKPDNVLVDTADPGRITAVLDWEMSTLGDPLADLGLLLVYWERGELNDDPATSGMATAPGFLDARGVLDRYAQRSGIDVTGIAWYHAFGCYKLAVICEGIHYRYVQGLTVGEGFATSGDIVPGLVDHAHHILDADTPDTGRTRT